MQNHLDPVEGGRGRGSEYKSECQTPAIVKLLCMVGLSFLQLMFVKEMQNPENLFVAVYKG